eukprot:5415495-Pleurochrysis_carterae.AAC.3
MSGEGTVVQQYRFEAYRPRNYPTNDIVRLKWQVLEDGFVLCGQGPKLCGSADDSAAESRANLPMGGFLARLTNKNGWLKA